MKTLRRSKRSRHQTAIVILTIGLMAVVARSPAEPLPELFQGTQYLRYFETHSGASPLPVTPPDYPILSHSDNTTIVAAQDIWWLDSLGPQTAWEIQDRLRRNAELSGYQILVDCYGSECGKPSAWKQALGPLANDATVSQAYLGLGRMPIAGRYLEYLHVYINELGCCSRVMARRLQTRELPVEDNLLRQGQMWTVAYFQPSKTNVDALSDALLRKLANTLPSGQNYEITVTGYADQRGDEDKNRRLAQNRAEAIASLLERYGLNPDGISVRTGVTPSVSSDPALWRRVDLSLTQATLKRPTPSIPTPEPEPAPIDLPSL